MTDTTRLKRVVSMSAGGTPPVDDTSMWDDSDLPWVAITDMTRSPHVTDTDRRVSELGRKAKRLPVGPPGTLLFAMYASVGATAVLAVSASWNQAILGLTSRQGLSDISFVKYWLEYLRPELGALTRSNTQDNLNAEQVGNLPFPTLDVREQRAIADYLDRETARIDALIIAKRKAMALYAERRQALRDGVFRFDSGYRLKHLLASPMAYGVLVPEFVAEGDGVGMIRTYNLTPQGAVDHGDIAEIPRLLADQYRRTYLEAGDVILSVVGSMGRAAVVTEAEAGFNLNRPLARLRPRRELPPRLLWHWTQTTMFMDAAMLATGGGTAQPTLNLGDLANFHVGLPQDTEGWSVLIAELDYACARLDRLEETARQQVKLLSERRQALITAAVTGQIELPVAA